MERGRILPRPDVTTNSWTCPASEGVAGTPSQAAVDAQKAAGIMTVVAAGTRDLRGGTVRILRHVRFGLHRWATTSTDAMAGSAEGVLARATV